MSAPTANIQKWTIFNRVPNAQALADGLKIIPEHWSLTPLENKKPKRDNWQTEDFIPHSRIRDLILHGETKLSKEGNNYTAYWSGFGLRTGEPSLGLIVIDVDGSTAQPILEAISGGDIPTTVSWTSGKAGRFGLMFQIPDEVRPLLKDFTRSVITEWEGLETARDANGKVTELLEFRYNRCQSVLPPSRHPETGSYQWINSPENTVVAIAPAWLCKLLVGFANQEFKKERDRQERKNKTINWEQYRKSEGSKGDSFDLISFLENEVLPRLSVEQIFKWPGHNFREVGATLKGCPPWRESASGQSFHVWWDGRTWAWQDKATSEGGNAIQYRWKLKGGVGSPKGKDFVSIVEELAAEAGLEIPKFKGKNNAVKLSHKARTRKEWFEEYEARRKERAEFKLSRKANIEIKEGYLPTIDLFDISPGIVAIKGDWGIGKSFLISNWCKQWHGKILQVAHLNALLENTAPKFNCVHHRELKENIEFGGLYGFYSDKLSITDVSLAAMLTPEKWSQGKDFILIIDEIEQVLNSIQNNGNLKGKLRLQIRVKLEWMLRNASYIICSDRDLSDITLEYIEQVRGDNRKAFIIHHTGLKGISRKPITINLNKRKDEVLSKLVEDAKAGKKLLIPVENKSDLLAIERLLLESGVNDVFLAHGDNSNEPDVRKTIEQIDKCYTDYQILAFTMTMGTAVSLESEHFDKTYAFFSGDALAAAEQLQMPFRYRLDNEIEVWVSPKKRTLEIEPENLLLNLISKTQDTNNLICSTGDLEKLFDEGILPTAKLEIAEDDMPWLNHKLGLIARKNASMANPSQTLIDLLKDAGFTLNIVGEDEKSVTIEGEAHKETKKVIKDESDEAIANAELFNEEEFKSTVKNAGTLNKKQRDRLTKTILHRTLGIEIDKNIVKLERTKKLTRGVKMLRLLLGDEQTAIAHDLKDRENNPDINDQKFYAEKRRLLIELEIPKFIERLKNGWSYSQFSREVVELANRARMERARIKRLLGFSFSLEKIKGKNGETIGYKDGNSKIVGLLLNYLCIQCVRQQKRELLVLGQQSDIVNYYSLNQEHWAMLENIMNYQALQPNTPTLEKVIEESKIFFDKAQSQPAQGLEGVTHPSDFVIYNKQPLGCVTGGNTYTASVSGGENLGSTPALCQDWMTLANQRILSAWLAEVKDFRMLRDVLAVAPLEAIREAVDLLPSPQHEKVSYMVRCTCWDDERQQWRMLPLYVLNRKTTSNATDSSMDGHT